MLFRVLLLEIDVALWNPTEDLKLNKDNKERHETEESSLAKTTRYV